MEAGFHFLRPLWLLALIPGIWLLWRLYTARRGAARWEEACDPHLLPHLLVGGRGGDSPWPMRLVGLGWLLAALALAGPVIEKLPQPVFQAAGARVVVIDLSRSMMAGDLKPSRLVRARFKALTFLRRVKEGRTGLVGFAGHPYALAPLTEDAQTIAALVPALEPKLMPIQGSRPGKALTLAVEMLKQAGAPGGDVLLITDGMDDPTEAFQAAEALKAAGGRLLILGMGTAEGAPIPSQGGGFLKDDGGSILLARFDPAPFQTLARRGGGRYEGMTADDGDLDRLLAAAERLQVTEEAGGPSDFSTDLWREEGPWLLLPLLPLAALAFRRGWLGALFLSLLFGAAPAEALEWDDLWKTPDQRGEQALRAGDAKRAAELFADPQRQGGAYYREGDYEKAAEAFGRAEGAGARYNLGNALARQNRLDEALAAYEETLKKNPDHADAAFNRDLVKRLLEQQKEQQQENKEGEQGDEGDQEKEPDAGEGQQGEQGDEPPPEEEKAPGEQEEQSGEQEEQSGGKEQAGEELEESPAEEHEEEKSEREEGAPGEEEENGKKSDRTLDQWLRSIPDDPGGLLRNKILLEHRRRGYAVKESKRPW